MKNKLTLGIMALGIIAVLGVSFVAAFPMMRGSWDITAEDKEANKLFMEQVREAIEAEDFDTWEELMLSQITLDNFNEHVARHAEMEELRLQKEQCLEDPENCEFEGWGEKKAYCIENPEECQKEGCTGDNETCPNQELGEGKNWEEIKEQCSENPEDCPYKNQGQMRKDFNKEQNQHKWAFWKGFRFGKNRA